MREGRGLVCGGGRELNHRLTETGPRPQFQRICVPYAKSRIMHGPGSRILRGQRPLQDGSSVGTTRPRSLQANVALIDKAQGSCFSSGGKRKRPSGPRCMAGSCCQGKPSCSRSQSIRSPAAARALTMVATE